MMTTHRWISSSKCSRCFFNLNRELATKVMLAVHTEGRAVCGLFTRDIAETKAMQVNQYARESQHPLLCEIEKDG